MDKSFMMADVSSVKC